MSCGTLFDQPWVFERRTMHLPGFVAESHLSDPNELEYPGHDRHLLCLLLSESNQQTLVRIGDQVSEQPQTKGSFWICPAHTPGTWAWKSCDRSLMIAFETQLLTQTAVALGLDASRVELLSTIDAIDPQIEAIAQLFQTELASSGIGGRLYAESLVQVLIVHLLRQYCAFKPAIEPKGGLTTAQRQRVLDYIHSYLDRPLRLADLAAVVGMSQYHFCRHFKQTMGIAPYQYVLRQRMVWAKSLLQKHHGIAEVASLVGCPDQSRFTKHFKKHIGVTPRMFLRDISTQRASKGKNDLDCPEA